MATRQRRDVSVPDDHRRPGTVQRITKPTGCPRCTARAHLGGVQGDAAAGLDSELASSSFHGLNWRPAPVKQRGKWHLLASAKFCYGMMDPYLHRMHDISSINTCQNHRR